jgi:hypothetical protein
MKRYSNFEDDTENDPKGEVRPKKRKSQREILNSYETGEYEEEDFYYERQEKFRNSSKKRRDY